MSSNHVADQRLCFCIFAYAKSRFSHDAAQIVCVTVCVVQLLCPFQQSFSHIRTVSGCDRELNVQFSTAASLWYQVPDTLLGTTPSHQILTLG